MSAPTDLGSRYIRAVIDHFAPRVKAEQDRVEAEMRAAVPGCSIFRHTYDVDYHQTYPDPWEREQVALAIVQCRNSSGGIHSATVIAELGTDEVGVTGWPLDKRSGWVRT